jgi:hypothetical protein
MSYGEDGDWSYSGGLGGSVLRVYSASDSSYLKTLDFGQVVVDGFQGQHGEWDIVLANIGDEDLAIGGFAGLPEGSHFLLSDLSSDLVIRPGEEVPATLRFDPLATGEHEATWTIFSDALNNVLEIDLSGFGLSPDADLDVTFSSNNLGGAWIGDQPVQAEDVLKLTNVGSQPLSIYDVSLGEGAGVFGIDGLPVDTSFAHPLVLEPGESRQLDVLFLPTEAGLQLGLIHIFSDDPDQPIATVTVVGTGIDGSGASWAGNYVAIQTPGNAPSHNRSDANGGFTVGLGPGTSYTYVAFDPISGLVSHQSGVTDNGGQFLEQLSAAFYASTEDDSDGDGLPDDVELAIGSAIDQPDTNGDGVDDYESIMRGIDPLAHPSSTNDGGSGFGFDFGDSGWLVALQETPDTPPTSDSSRLDAQILEPLIATAQANWADAGAEDDLQETVSFRVADLPGRALGKTLRTSQDEYLITVDIDAGGYGWFVDPTPFLFDEFGPNADGQLIAIVDGPAADAVDLLTVITHELGHVIGLADRSSSEGVMMSSLLPVGVRRLPGIADLDGPYLDDQFTDLGWYNGADDGRDSHELLNGDFSISDPGDPMFGWTQRGDAPINLGTAAPGETGLLNAGISQVFLVPEESQYLWFDIVSLDLHASALNPPDTFEVALLDPVTLQPIVDSAVGLDGTDSLLNIQATGEVFFGSAVHLPFAFDSGDVTDLALPFTVEIALPDTVAGKEVALYFDLLGFGDDDSHVRIDNVRVTEGQPLTLTLALDPVSDSGQLGDRVTNINPADLTGMTQPGAEVVLDTDGDGFDDGAVTADASGNFTFVGVPLISGSNHVLARATFDGQVATASVVITLDAQIPSGQLIAPSPDMLTNDDLGYVEIQWTDAGSAGLDPETFDPTDITVTGVTINRTEDLGEGLIRYWYDGSMLSDGTVEVAVLADAVSDVAGNLNAAAIATFTLDTQPPTGQLVVPEPGTLTNEDLAHIDIQWIDVGLAGLDVSTFDPTDASIGGVTVDHAEDLGDGLVRYWYAGSTLPDGVVDVTIPANVVSDLAGNRNLAVSVTFALDTQPPAAKLIAPAPDVLTNRDLGYVDIQWTDAGVAGLDTSTFDTADVTIAGVTVNRFADLGGGVVRYWYEGSMLADGVVDVTISANVVADLAGNRNASAGWDFSLDTQSPAGQLVAPAPGVLTNEDLGYVDIQWTDTGPAELDASTFDTADVTIAGVTVNRVADLGGGAVRYWYEGSTLTDGIVDVTLLADAVSDLAGNRNLAVAATFSLDTTPPVGQLVTPAPGLLTKEDLGYVEIQWSDIGLAGLDLSSLDSNDVLISGVVVNRMEDLGDGLARYWYEGSDLVDGTIDLRILTDAVRDLAGNRSRESAWTFTLDRQSPTGQLVTPEPEVPINQDLGYVEIQWVDVGLAGLSPGSFDADDVSIAGVAVDRIENLGDGLIRYFYADALPTGLIEVTLNSQAVLDQVGNSNAVQVASFVFDSLPPTGEMTYPEPNTVVTVDPGYIEVHWRDAGTAGLIASSIDASDVIVSGVSVDRVEEPKEGVFRYWYSDDGQSLPDGDIQVQLVAGAVRDAAGNTNAASTFEFEFAISGSISGYVYLDVNNSGSMDPVELRLPNVPVTIHGPVTRTVETDADGCYLFEDLLPGTYEIHELIQPSAFMDGLDTPGLPRSGSTTDDWFHDVQVDPNMHLTNYNFGELGLRGDLVSKQLYLASSPPQGSAVASYVTITEDASWLRFEAPHDALMTTEVTTQPSDIQIELYTSDMMPVKLTRGATTQTTEVDAEQLYVLYIGGNEPEISATIWLMNPAPAGAFHNAGAPVDVNDDQMVSPVDALIVINDLNRNGIRALLGDNQTGNYVDVNGDGYATPLDALLVINHLNREGIGEAEGERGDAMAPSALLLPSTNRFGLQMDTTVSDSRPPEQTLESTLSNAVDFVPGRSASEIRNQLEHWFEKEIDWTDEDLEDILAELADDLEGKFDL